MGPYADVVSFNHYDVHPPTDMLREIHRVTGLPVRVTEFSFRARGSGLPNTRGAGIVVDVPADPASLALLGHREVGIGQLAEEAADPRPVVPDHGHVGGQHRHAVRPGRGHTRGVGQTRLIDVAEDEVEAEQELMGGVLTEYSGPPLAVFKLTKAMMLSVLTIFLATIFFGGLRFTSTGQTVSSLVKYLVPIVLIVLIRSALSDRYQFASHMTRARVGQNAHGTLGVTHNQFIIRLNHPQFSGFDPITGRRLPGLITDSTLRGKAFDPRSEAKAVKLLKNIACSLRVTGGALNPVITGDGDHMLFCLLAREFFLKKSQGGLIQEKILG